jgi:hypothetical protein
MANIINMLKKNKSNRNPADNNSMVKRLPCRGCIAGCKNYSRCDGTPWQMLSDSEKTNPEK